MLMQLEHLNEFLNSLPSDVACVVWDVLNNRVNLETIILADNSEHFQEYSILGAVVGANQNRLEGFGEVILFEVEELYQKWQEGK